MMWHNFFILIVFLFRVKNLHRRNDLVNVFYLYANVSNMMNPVSVETKENLRKRKKRERDEAKGKEGRGGRKIHD